MEFSEVTAGQSKDMPAKMVLYGVPKIGKSNFAASIDDVFFINIEGGLDYLHQKVRSKLNSYEEVIGWLKHIYENDDFTCGRIVIDSIDWVEALAIKKIEKMHGHSITDKKYDAFTYGNGYAMVAEQACKIIQWLDAIYSKKGIPCLLIAHSQLRNIDLPTKDPYSRHELKLGKALAAKINEWADLTLFADYSFVVTKDGKTSEPKRVLCAGGNMAYVGGGRMKLSKEIPLSYSELEKEITQND